jgi:hypothetical protein
MKEIERRESPRLCQINPASIFLDKNWRGNGTRLKRSMLVVSLKDQMIGEGMWSSQVRLSFGAILQFDSMKGLPRLLKRQSSISC